MPPGLSFSVFFFNDTATTEIYTLSLHDALPTSTPRRLGCTTCGSCSPTPSPARDRKSTRLNSSHMSISYAVFCLKKKKLGIDHVHHRQVDAGECDRDTGKDQD